MFHKFHITFIALFFGLIFLAITSPIRTLLADSDKQIKARLTEIILQRVPRYVASRQDKALAACIDWQKTSIDYVRVYNTFWYYTSEGSDRPIARSKLMSQALYRCEKRKSPEVDCQCVRVAADNRSVLRVPKHVMDRLLKEPRLTSEDAPKDSAALLRGGARRAFEEYLDYRHFKAFATYPATGRWSWRRGHHRPERAVALALKKCGPAPTCNLYAIGNIVVIDMSDEEIDAAIAFYGSNRFAFYGSDVDATREDLRKWMAETTPSKLLDVAKVGNTGIVQRLLDQGVDVNTKDEIGDTALMHAAAGGHAETVEVLLSRAADVNAETVANLTALDRAELALEFGKGFSIEEVENYREVIGLLQEAGASSGWR